MTSSTSPMSFERREANYWAQNGRRALTPRQRRRLAHKFRRDLHRAV